MVGCAVHFAMRSCNDYLRCNMNLQQFGSNLHPYFCFGRLYRTVRYKQKLSPRYSAYFDFTCCFTIVTSLSHFFRDQLNPWAYCIIITFFKS